MSVSEKERIYWDRKADQEQNWCQTEKEELKHKISGDGPWWKGLVPQIQNKCIIDIGCATGITLAYCGLTGNKSVGIDISKGELKKALQLHKMVDIDAKLVNSTIKNLPFKDNTFDVVHIRWVIHHLSRAEVKESFAEISRILKKGGLILLFETNYYYPIRWLTQTSHLKDVNIFRKLALEKDISIDPEEKAFTNDEYLALLEDAKFEINAIDYHEGFFYFLPGLFFSNESFKHAMAKLDILLSSFIPEAFCINIMVIAKKTD